MPAAKYGSVKRFGSRYGRTVREKLGKIEKEQRKKQKCPYSNKKQVKRLSPGIWYSPKTGKKFTARAYTAERTKIKEAASK